nr:hypothetical protein [Tanacetum cinerariifolium]
MFRVEDLEGNEVIVDVREKIVEKEVSTVNPVTTVGEVVTVASVEDSAVLTTTTTTNVDDELTLAKALIAIKAVKLKEERIKMEKDEANRDMIEELDDVQAIIDAHRAGQELEQESAKKHKLAEPEQAKVADDTTELKRCLEIVPKDDDDVAIEAIPLSF